MTNEREQALRLAREAGFKVAGDRIMAADGSTFVLANASIERLISLAQKEALDRAEATTTWAKRCQCDMRTKLVGDGCRYCNPEQAFEYIEERAEAAEKRVAELEAYRIKLLDERLEMADRIFELEAGLDDRLAAATELLQRWHSGTSIYDKTLVWSSLRYDTSAFLSEGKWTST